MAVPHPFARYYKTRDLSLVAYDEFKIWEEWDYEPPSPSEAPKLPKRRKCEEERYFDWELMCEEPETEEEKRARQEAKRARKEKYREEARKEREARAQFQKECAELDKREQAARQRKNASRTG